jgi:hypothetical protein
LGNIRCFDNAREVYFTMSINGKGWLVREGG